MKENNIENLYQTSKTEKPPNSLDNFILAQAKNSCDEKQILHNTTIKKRWLFRLSTAAVVVLSFSIILNLQTENTVISESPVLMQKSKANRIETIQNKSDNNIASPKPIGIKMERSAATDDQEYMAFDSVDEGLGEVFEEEVHSDSITIQKTGFMKQELDVVPALIPTAPTHEISIKKQQDHAVMTEAALEIKLLDTGADETSKPKNYSPKTENKKKKDSNKLSAGANVPRPQSVKDNDDYASKKVINYSVLQDDQLSFTQQLEQLDGLIKSQNIAEAQQLFMQLQKSYPYYDFSNYKAILEN